MRSGFPNIYSDRKSIGHSTTNPGCKNPSKKSVKAGDDPNGGPSFLRESPPPDVVSQSRSYFLVHVTGTVWLTRAS